MGLFWKAEMYSPTYTDSEAPDIVFLSSLTYESITEPITDEKKKLDWNELDEREVFVYFSRYIMDIAMVCVEEDEMFLKQAGLKTARKVLDAMGSSYSNMKSIDFKYLDL